MSHQQHGGYESMAREKCPCPTVVARPVLLLWAEWIIQRCLSVWGESRTVGSGRATGASLAGACKLDKSYRTIICVQHLKHAGGLEEEKGWGKGREGDSNNPVSIFPNSLWLSLSFMQMQRLLFSVPAFHWIVATSSERPTADKTLLFYSTAFNLKHLVYALIKMTHTTTNCLCVALPV